MGTKHSLILWAAILLILLSIHQSLPGAPKKQAEPSVKPSLLFVGSIHNEYLTKPLYKMGFEIDTCKPGELKKKLGTQLYNVLVLPTLTTDSERKTALEFARQGGGLFLANPGGSAHHEKDWLGAMSFLESLGVTPRWDALEETDEKNLYVDELSQKLSWTDKITPPFNDNVKGVWIHVPFRLGGASEFVMSFKFPADWQVILKAAGSVVAHPSKSTQRSVQKWIPKDTVKSPAIMAVRPYGKGRIAVIGIRSQFFIHPPLNCPTAKIMLSGGPEGKQSNLVQLLANTFAWLGEPSEKAGYGGNRSPHVVIEPPVKTWAQSPEIDWKNPGKEKMLVPLADRPQIRGLVGARTKLSSGTGTVAEYAAEARKAGLDYIVFLEDSLKMNQAKWDQLVSECRKVSDDNFAALPGLTIEDAQGNHMFTLGDGARFPKDEFLLKDRRLNTTSVSRTEPIFKYFLEHMKYDMINGYWNHKKNELHHADYKLANSFVIKSRDAENNIVDDAVDEYLYWQGFGGSQAIFAFEFMNSPKQVAERARNGWKVVSTSGGAEGDGSYLKDRGKGVNGMRKRWEEGHHWYPPYQYISNGPEILAWQVQNCLAMPAGNWWRPDRTQYRVRLHVKSDAGLRKVTILEGDRGIFRQWAPKGKKEFEQTFSLPNSQQRDLVLIVEDMKGHEAISMEIWNRNLMMNQFICGDRCNFLGNCRIRTAKDTQIWVPVGFRANLGNTPSKGQTDLTLQPDISLTQNTPTLPIDGRPIGAPKFTLSFNPSVPGELTPFSYPTTYLLGPDIAVGQVNYRTGYDPTELGADKTTLGHPYKNPEKQFRIGKNAWTSWYRQVPLKKLSGWVRIFACNYLPGEFRTGWIEYNWTFKDDVTLDSKDKSWTVVQFTGEMMKDDKPWDAASGDFVKSSFAVARTGIVFPIDGARLSWVRLKSRNGDIVRLIYRTPDGVIKKGTHLRFRIGFAGTPAGTPKSKIINFAKDFGIAEPGRTAYKIKVNEGRLVSDYFCLALDGQQKGVAFDMPKVYLPAFLPTLVENLNPNWSVYLQDRSKSDVNFRAVPFRDGTAYAMLNTNRRDSDIFIGHPITSSDENLKILVSWYENGKWFVEFHNATGKKINADVSSNPEWTRFDYRDKVSLAPGTSRIVYLEEKNK